jgi:hypothetical protein
MKIKFQQTSNAAAKSKFRKMASGAGWSGVKYFKCGFADWTIENDNDFPEPGTLAIYCNTTYHSESTINEMYKKNCKNWSR